MMAVMELIDEQTPGCHRHTSTDSGLEAVGSRVLTQLNPTSSLPLMNDMLQKPSKGVDQMPEDVPHRGSDSSCSGFCFKCLHSKG